MQVWDHDAVRNRPRGGKVTGNLRVEKQSEDVVDARAECMVNFMEILRGDTRNPSMFRLHYSQAFILRGQFGAFQCSKEIPADPGRKSCKSSMSEAKRRAVTLYGLQAFPISVNTVLACETCRLITCCTGHGRVPSLSVSVGADRAASDLNTDLITTFWLDQHLVIQNVTSGS